MVAAVVGLLLASVCVGCGDDKKKDDGKKTALDPVAAPVAPAGEVRAVHGQVHAQRADAHKRALKVHDPVWADDTVTTAAAASVTIALDHNGAIWTLLGGRSKRIDRSAAWRAKKGTAPLFTVAPTVEHTVAAGRHSEVEAATSEESAERPKLETEDEEAAEVEPVVARPRPKPKARAKAASSRKAQIMAARKNEILKVLGSSGSGKGGTVSDLLAGGKGGSIDDAFSGSGGVRKAERRVQGLVSVQKLTVGGDLPKAVVDKTIRRRMGALRRCYAIGLRMQPSLAGRILIEVEITAGGKVGSVKVIGKSFGAAKVEHCLLSNLKRWRFPAGPKGDATTFRVALVFKTR